MAIDIDNVITLSEMIGAAVAGGWITHLLSIRSRVRQEKARTQKAEAEVDTDKIDNIRKTMDEVYRPIIEDLKRQVEDLRTEVRQVRQENARLSEENRVLRNAIQDISPEPVPSFQSIKAKNQPRGKGGQFIKIEDACD